MFDIKEEIDVVGDRNPKVKNAAEYGGLTILSLFPGTEPQARASDSQQNYQPKSLVWLTPPFILRALGEFDLDPCAAPEPRPWATAKVHWGHADNSLGRPWKGRIWLNPPYGPKESIRPWMHRMAEHNHGTALVFARTETRLFFETVWGRATAIMFLRGRLCFHRPDGALARNDTHGGYAAAPSVLIAYGESDARALKASSLIGEFVSLRRG